MTAALALVVRSPFFSVGFTLLAYAAAMRLHRCWRWIPPIVAACLPIVVLLLLLRIPYADYNHGGRWITWVLGSATVALAVPMHRHGVHLRGQLGRLALVVLGGSIAGMVTAGLTAWLLGAPHAVTMAALPKSVTTPIAVEVSRELGGIPQITVALVVLAGLLGSIFGPPLLRAAGVRGDYATGAAIGTSAHGIGTAGLMRSSERQASVSSWAMAAAGIFVSLLAAVLAVVLRLLAR